MELNNQVVTIWGLILLGISCIAAYNLQYNKDKEYPEKLAEALITINGFNALILLLLALYSF